MITPVQADELKIVIGQLYQASLALHLDEAKLTRLTNRLRELLADELPPERIVPTQVPPRIDGRIF